MQKLNSMRFLESRRISYTTHTYEYDPENPPDASEVAERIGLAPSQVFKTLVVTGASHGKPILVMLAANHHLDLKRCAASIGQKRLEMMPKSETERLTGLKVGGIGAFALVPKRWSSYLERSAEQFEKIYVNAGQRGVMLGVGVQDILQSLNAALIDAHSQEAAE